VIFGGMDNLEIQGQAETLTQCFHCGNDCLEDQFDYDDRNFWAYFSFMQHEDVDK
jgi:hypothetical protein